MSNRIIIFLLSLLFILPIVFYSINFNGGVSNEHSRWGEFGSLLSGIYGSFAFIILAYTTNLTRQQFKTQNEDNIFFKLYESLQIRITNSSIIVNDVEFTANKTLKTITEYFEERLEIESIELARILLAESPEKVAPVSYRKIFEAINGEKSYETFHEDMQKFILDINSQPDFSARWEKLKYYINSRGNESEKVREALRATGCINFYEIAYDKRQAHYRNVSQSLLSEYGDFLDGYLHNISYIMEFVEKASNKSVYLEFIKSQLTKYEVVIIFYLIAGQDNKLKNHNKFYTLGIMDRILTTECQFLMIDRPSIETMKKELNYVFSECQMTNKYEETNNLP